MKRALAATALLLLVCCKKPAHTPVPDGSADPPVSEAPVDAGPKLAPARCVMTDRGVSLTPSIGVPPSAAGGPASDDLEIGDAVELPGGAAAVGVVRKTEAGIVASVATLSADASSVSFVDLGAPIGDAPTPEPIRVEGGLLSAFYARPAEKKDPKEKKDARGAPMRDMTVHRIEGGKAIHVATISQQWDESLAFDATGARDGKTAVIAWDEDALGLTRGHVRIMVLGADGKVLGSRVASPDTSDAEVPRVVARRGGYWLAWVARRPEKPEPPVDASMTVEGPGRRKTFEWIELVALDAKGEAAGPVRKLTSESGHVSVFELVPRGDSDDLDILARDDDQPAETAGGRVVRISVSLTKADPPVGIVGEGVGRGDPLVVADPSKASAILTWIDTNERVRVVPLDEGRTPRALQSIEDALDRSRPLLAKGAAAGKLSYLASFPADPKLQLRIVECGGI